MLRSLRDRFLGRESSRGEEEPRLIRWIVVGPTKPPTYYGPFESRSVARSFARNEGPVTFPTPGRVERLRRP